MTLNCGYGRGFSVREVIAAFELETGRPLSIVPGPRRPGDVAKVISDAAKIRSVLGWRPRYEDLAEIVRSCLAWEGRLDALAMTART